MSKVMIIGHLAAMCHINIIIYVDIDILQTVRNITFGSVFNSLLIKIHLQFQYRFLAIVISLSQIFIHHFRAFSVNCKILDLLWQTLWCIFKIRVNVCDMRNNISNLFLCLNTRASAQSLLQDKGKWAGTNSSNGIIDNVSEISGHIVLILIV